jgi:hypothetical protein
LIGIIFWACLNCLYLESEPHYEVIKHYFPIFHVITGLWPGRYEVIVPTIDKTSKPGGFWSPTTFLFNGFQGFFPHGKATKK